MPTDGFIRPGNILDLEGNEIVDVGAPLSGTSADRVQDRNTAITAALAAYATSAALTSGLAGKADLVAGKVPTSQVPSLAITDTFTVASQAAMLALACEVGDVAVRTDTSETFILAAAPASTLANWVKLATPTDLVISVNGQQGVVVLDAADVGAAAASHGHAQSDVTGLVAALAAKADQSALSAHTSDTGNPHGVTKAQVGLGAVTNDAQLPLAGGTLTGRTVTAPVTLTYSGSTFTPAAGAGNLYRGTLTQATTVANPSGTPADGQVIRVALTQDGTGGWAVTWGSKYLGSDDVALGQPASGASKRSVFTFEYDSAADRWLLLGKNAGYQL